MVADPNNLTDHERIAIVSIVATATAAAEKELKDEFATKPRGTRLPVTTGETDEDGEALKLGTVGVNQGRLTVTVTDKEQALAYVAENFGHDLIQTVYEISPQGMKSLEAAAKAAHAAKRPLPPGVSVRRSKPHTVYTPERGVDQLEKLREMISDGRVNLAAALGVLTVAAIAAPDPGER